MNPLLISLCLLGALLCAGCGADVRRVVDPSTGRVLEQATWSGVQLHGDFRTWFVDGTPREEGRWEHGIPVGTRTLWHGTGRKSEQGEYVDGVKHGPWPRWYEDGTPEWSGSWEAGAKNGTWTHFDEAGDVDEVEQWEHGTRVQHSGNAGSG